MIQYRPGDWVEIGEVFRNTSTNNPDYNINMRNSRGNIFKVRILNIHLGWVELEYDNWFWHPEWLKPIPVEKALEFDLNEAELTRSLELHASYWEKNRDSL